MSMFKGAVPLGLATLLLAVSAGLIAWVASTALIQLVARRANEPRPFHKLGTDLLDRLTAFHGCLLMPRYEGLLRKQPTKAGEPRDLLPAHIAMPQQPAELVRI